MIEAEEHSQWKRTENCVDISPHRLVQPRAAVEGVTFFIVAFDPVVLSVVHFDACQLDFLRLKINLKKILINKRAYRSSPRLVGLDFLRAAVFGLSSWLESLEWPVAKAHPSSFRVFTYIPVAVQIC